MDVEAPLDQVQEIVNNEGTLEEDWCFSLCSMAGNGSDVTACMLLDEVTPSTGSEGMTSGHTSAGSDGTSSVGDGSTGAEETGTGAGGTSTSDASTSGPAGSTGAGATAGTVGATGGMETVTIHCEYVEICIGGRGHQALRSRPVPTGDDRLGCWLAATAHSEAASVVAFLALADELAAHGAPAALVLRARAAAQDEVAHARAMTRLAQGRGAQVEAPRFDAIEVRDLTTIAIENAAEGCVRETWAALEAAHQARAAGDPELRRAMAGIAADEARHAELSHDLDAWIRTQLDDEAVARVDAARRRAARELLAGMQGERDPELCARAGLPATATARRLCEGLHAQLWA
jgi:rubrerythrin